MQSYMCGGTPMGFRIILNMQNYLLFIFLTHKTKFVKEDNNHKTGDINKLLISFFKIDKIFRIKNDRLITIEFTVIIK